MNTLLLSLCIPTNGIVEWVIPVLESIYQQNVDDNLFEVVITDNGVESTLDKAIDPFCERHKNLHYFKTCDFEFLNQISCFKNATGELIKFVNHRSIMQEGSINYLLDFAKKFKDEKPITYFATGALEKQPIPESVNRIDENTERYDTFDLFVQRLNYFCSWSTGLSMWKDDFSKIPDGMIYNKFFPHTGLLFFFRPSTGYGDIIPNVGLNAIKNLRLDNKLGARTYIIDNKKLMEDIPVSHEKKGKYNLFYDFAIEFPSIICGLVRSGDVTRDTFIKVKNELRKFLSVLYCDFIVRKEPCSYDLSGADEALQIYWGKKELKVLYRNAKMRTIRLRIGKLLRKFKLR